MEKEKELPSVVLTERAAQVFKDSCEAEGLTLQDTFLRIGVDREALIDILGPIRIDYSDKNLVEQGFVFEQLINGHQCGCGESFTPVRDLKNG